MIQSFMRLLTIHLKYIIFLRKSMLTSHRYVFLH